MVVDISPKLRGFGSGNSPPIPHPSITTLHPHTPPLSHHFMDTLVRLTQGAAPEIKHCHHPLCPLMCFARRCCCGDFFHSPRAPAPPHVPPRPSPTQHPAHVLWSLAENRAAKRTLFAKYCQIIKNLTHNHSLTKAKKATKLMPFLVDPLRRVPVVYHLS